MKLAVAVCESSAHINEDDAPVIERLEAHGVQAAAAVWSDAHVDWASFDAVLIRSTWDYHLHYDRFTAWLDALDRLQLPVINPTRVVRWNSDKRYLLELAMRGVTIVPSRVAQKHELAAALASHRGDVVVKPTVSASAWATVRGAPGEERFERALGDLPEHVSYLVQPFVAEVAQEGEWSLLFFGGRYSHAVLKRPAPGDYRVQREFGGVTAALAPPDFALATAQSTLSILERLGHRDLVYARIDGVCCEGRFLIMEVELIEPFLFLASSPGAVERCAAAVLESLSRAVR